MALCGSYHVAFTFAFELISFLTTDISLEYCDEPEADSDCNLTLDGKPVRHIRLDCRVALVDGTRQRNFVNKKTKRIDQRYYETQAPWFL